MARPRIGIGFKQNGVIRTGIRLRSGARVTWDVTLTNTPPTGVPVSVEWARLVSLEVQSLYNRGGVTDEQVRARARGKGAPAAALPTDNSAPAAGETVDAFFVRFCAARTTAGHRTVRDDRYRYNRHIKPHLGALAIAAVTAEHIETVRDALDAKIAAGELSPKTASNAWVLLTSLLGTACRAKKATGLRVRADNPCTDVAPPEAGDPRLGPQLYPSEWLAFVSSEAVPVELAQAAAVCLYQYLRAGEADALTVADVDLAHGTLAVFRATDKKSGDVVEPKTRAGIRTVPIEPALRPLFAHLVARARALGTTRLLPKLPPRNDLAALLRAGLQAARVERPALFLDDATHRPLWWHDLRASGITWAVIRGDGEQKIMRRAGHTDFATTTRYVREAEHLGADGFGTVFPPLPARLLGAQVPAGSVTGSVTEAPADAIGVEIYSARDGGRTPPRDTESRESSANRAADGSTEGPLATPDGRFVTGFVTGVTEHRYAAEARLYHAFELAALADLDALQGDGGGVAN